MNITDTLLGFGPLSLVIVGTVLFFFGWLFGGGQSRIFYTVVLVTVLSAFLSQVALGVGFARPSNTHIPTLMLYTWSPGSDAGFGVTLGFRGDLLAWLFAVPLTLLALISTLYLMVRRPFAETQDGILPGRLYGLILLAEGAGLAVFYSADLIATYFWLEAVGLALYLLSGPGLRGASARPISYRALGISFFAGQLIFAPLLVIVSRNGGHSNYTDVIPAVLDTTLFSVLMIGCLAKAAQFPFQAWLGGFEDLPGAVYALLTAGFLFPFAIYLPVRLQALAGERIELLANLPNLLLPIGTLTIFFGTASALRLNDKQRLTSKIGLLAAAQFGFVLIALGLNDLAATFQQLASLIVGTALLFLCADQFQIENAEPYNPDNRTNPPLLGRPASFRAVLLGVYLVGALNFAGLPLSPAYNSRWQMLGTLLNNGNRFYFAMAIVGSVLGMLALLQGLIVFMIGPRRTTDAKGGEWFWALSGPLLLAGLSVGLGFYPAFTNGLIALATTQVRGNAVVSGPTPNPASGWLGILFALGLIISFTVYWMGKSSLAVGPYSGGLIYGPLPDPNRPRYARTGRSKMALKVIEKEEELPEGFDDDFFSGAFKKKAAFKQAAERVLPDPRLSTVDYFGPLQESLATIYKFLDTGYIGNFFGRLLIRLSSYIRIVFEWLVERFYPALTIFIVIILVILLTR